MTDTTRLIADARRALTALSNLIDYCDDPGTEALCAQHSLATTLNTADPSEIVEIPKRSPDAAEVLRIVAEYVIESNDVGGIDCNDLADRLRTAGYDLPDEDE